MRAASILAMLALLAPLAACGGASPCQKLGERICSCSGLDHSACKKQVQRQLESSSFDESKCEAALDTCHEPEGVPFCEWLQTADAKVRCGLAP